MPGFLKQATAAQARAIGPFVDDTDFKTAETGLTIANTDIKLVVNGGASANKNSGGGTHRVNGVYGVTFDATDTATVGEMQVSVVVAGALAVFDKFFVVEEAVYDALFAASAPGYLQPTVAARTLDVSAGGEAGVDWANIGSPTTAVNLSATNIDVDQIVASVSGAVGSVTGAVGSVTGAVGSVTGAVGSVSGLTAATVHSDLDDIQARLPAALTSDGNMKSDALRVNGSALAAARMQRAGASMVLGTCAALGSTTSVIASSLAPTSAVNDQFNGRIIIFADDTTTSALRGQATDITDYVHATLTFTVTALTTAPVNGDTFVIV